jgi:hypothetical protein
MENRKLIVELKLQGGADSQVIRAARIQLDGRGSLLVFDAQDTTSPSKVRIRELQSLSIRQASHMVATTAA